MKVTITTGLCNAIHTCNTNGVVLIELDPQKVAVCTTDPAIHAKIKRVFKSSFPHTEIIAANDHHPPIHFAILSGTRVSQVQNILRCV